MQQKFKTLLICNEEPLIVTAICIMRQINEQLRHNYETNK